ncbi:MAG: spore coat U domain-containing protein [Pseudomonadota bacterium]|nr:spore coat U domain-containing protein [Pseudomonadota bacterium]
MSKNTTGIKLTAFAAAVLSAGMIMSNGAVAGGTTTLTVNARISGVCQVTTAPALLDFGTISPSGVANATAITTFLMKCSNGVTSTASTDDGGLNFSGGTKRMQHSGTATAFLPYSITYSGDVGFAGAGFGAAAASRTVTINGIVTPANYNGALQTTGAQVYTDLVTITVNP